MELAELIDVSTLGTMNGEDPNKIMGNCNNSPDISIASGDLMNSITWRPILTLASAHLPIIILIEIPPNFISVDNRTFVNFNKANWVGFTEFTESTFTRWRVSIPQIDCSCYCMHYPFWKNRETLPRFHSQTICFI